MESNITILSLDYMERMKFQNNNVLWAEQVSMEEDISLPFPKQLQDQNRQAKVNNQTHLEFTIYPLTSDIEPNLCIEPSVILYCYKITPRKETISCTFLNLVDNIWDHNTRRI